MLKKLLPALCCAALAAGCASTATTGSSAEPLSGEKPAQLADRSFMWVDGASEDWDLPPSLRFGADGRISGQAGCNRMLGSWKQDGKTIDLGQIATTMRLCGPAFMEVEKKFLSLLGAAKYITAAADGEGIVLWNDKGEKLVELLPERAGKCD